jgi:FtsZ-interacting cell division protein ZipA
MAAWLWVVIAVIVIALIAVAVVAARKQRTTRLRERFGPEYDRTLREREDKGQAETDLRERAQRRDKLEIRPLTPEARGHYAQQWESLQTQFVDQPVATVVSAHELVCTVMRERGYPVDDFDTQSDLVSVDHPDVVDDFRVAHGVYRQAQQGEVDTEDLRTAMVRYRSLFAELLHAGAEPQTTPTDDQPNEGIRS